MESTLCADLRRDNDGQCRIIETFFAQSGAMRYADLHFARLRQTAQLLDYPLDERRVRAAIDGAVNDKGDQPLRVRLTVNHMGEAQCEAYPLSPSADHWVVSVAQERLASDDPWLQVKTTRRALYDNVRAELPSGIDEMLFLNERDELCEGTITTIFIEHDGMFLTPPLGAGCLPGVLRRALLNDGRAREATLSLNDVTSADQLWVGNALRGLIRADLRL